MSVEHNFFDDYSEGAHPRILEALGKTNLSQETGYGNDSISQKAANLIKERTGNMEASVHFVSGGTQANLIVLSSALKPYEAVISAKTAHINVHEAGAIEATGHKVIDLESPDGKLKPDQISDVVKSHTDEHMVKPKVVFISQATELGTVYSKSELEELSKVCKNNGLFLYLDGARLGSSLTSKGSDLTLPEVARFVDVFYIGGTKNGALLGEAIVINNPDLKDNFRFHMKQRGALLAKGRVLGIQFLELFRDNLYLDLAQYANQMANQLVGGISKLGYRFLADSPTNQIFPILPNTVIDRLKESYGFYPWSEVDAENTSIRLVTSWATPKEVVEKFITALEKISH